MAARDQLTGRGAQTGNRRSHALNHSRRVWNVNLQKVKVPTADGTMKTVRISTRTLRTLRKQGRL